MEQIKPNNNEEQKKVTMEKIQALKVINDSNAREKQQTKIQVSKQAKQRKHKRRRSQPSQMDQPDKFDKMYEQLLVKYTNILNDGEYKQVIKINQTIKVNLETQQKTQNTEIILQEQKINKRKQFEQKILGNNSIENSKQSDFQKQFMTNMMMILQNDQDSMNQLLKECKGMAKDW